MFTASYRTIAQTTPREMVTQRLKKILHVPLLIHNIYYVEAVYYVKADNLKPIVMFKSILKNF